MMKRVLIGVALLALIAPPDVSAAEKPAFFCKLAPGKTYVDWRNESRATRVHMAWGDGEGNLIAEQTLIPSEQRHSRFKIKTPGGAAEFGVTFYDGTLPYAVGGMVCQ